MLTLAPGNNAPPKNISGKGIGFLHALQVTLAIIMRIIRRRYREMAVLFLTASSWQSRINQTFALNPRSHSFQRSIYFAQAIEFQRNH